MLFGLLEPMICSIQIRHFARNLDKLCCFWHSKMRDGEDSKQKKKQVSYNFFICFSKLTPFPILAHIDRFVFHIGKQRYACIFNVFFFGKKRLVQYQQHISCNSQFLSSVQKKVFKTQLIFQASISFYLVLKFLLLLEIGGQALDHRISTKAGQSALEQ